MLQSCMWVWWLELESYGNNVLWIKRVCYVYRSKHWLPCQQFSIAVFFLTLRHCSSLLLLYTKLCTIPLEDWVSECWSLAVQKTILPYSLFPLSNIRSVTLLLRIQQHMSSCFKSAVCEAKFWLSVTLIGSYYICKCKNVDNMQELW